MRQSYKKHALSFFVTALFSSVSCVAMDVPRESSVSVQQALPYYCETLFQTILAEIKHKVGERASDCFMSYSCGYDEQTMTPEEIKQRVFVDRLVRDLTSVGVIPDYDLNNLPIGYDIDTFLDKIHQTRNVILLFSKKFKKQCDTDRNSGAFKELHRILRRIHNLRGDCDFLAPILLDDIANNCIPEGVTLPSHIYVPLHSDDDLAYYQAFFDLLEHKLFYFLTPPCAHAVDIAGFKRAFQMQLRLHHDASSGGQSTEIDSERDVFSYRKANVH